MPGILAFQGLADVGMTCHPRGEATVSHGLVTTERLPVSGSLTPGRVSTARKGERKVLTPREDLVRVRLELLGRRREGLLFATLLRLDLVAGGGVPREVSRPVDDTEQLAGRHVEVCLVPIVLHLHV